MTPSEMTHVDAFWRSRSEDLKIMVKRNRCAIQIRSPGAFAEFRDAMYAEEDKPMETDSCRSLTDVQYAGPLYRFWKKIVIDTTTPGHTIEIVFRHRLHRAGCGDLSRPRRRIADLR